MKQRLLLVLLALFTSIGLVKAQTTGNGVVKLTIPKGKTVTITFNNNGADGTGNYDGNEATLTGIGKGSSLTISADESHKNNDSYTAVFYSGAYTSMTIGTGATSVELSGDSYTWPLETLNIASGNLTTLALGKAHANLESLTVGTNKLLKVPTKGTNMKTYSISAQSPELELNTTAAKGLPLMYWMRQALRLC